MSSSTSSSVSSSSSSGSGGSVEYQAIILATSIGSALFPLTSESDGSSNEMDTIGRAVLPIANRPLLWYQLDMIHKAGFPSLIVVTRDSMKKSIQRVIDEWKIARSGGERLESTNLTSPSGSSTIINGINADLTQLIEIDLVALDRYLGSADALRRIAPRIHTDFFVLGGDLVSNLPFQNLADVARAQDAGLVMAVSEDAEPSGDLKERKKQEAEAAAAGVDSQYFGIDADSKRLLLFKSQADVEEKLEVSKRLLAKHPRFTLHTRIKDAHLYLFSQWVLYFLKSKPSIVSIQSELIPCLVSGQFKHQYAEWKHYGKNSAQSLALRMSHAPRSNASDDDDQLGGLSQPIMNRGLSVLDASGTSLSTLPGSSSMTDIASSNPSNRPENFQESFRLFVYLTSANTFSMRANTLASYKNLNHELCSDREYAYMPWPTIATDNYADKIQKQFSSAVAIGRETVIGDGTTFEGDGSTVKRSCIGKGCTIGAKVKLHGCIIMDNVKIGEGYAQLQLPRHRIDRYHSLLHACTLMHGSQSY